MLEDVKFIEERYGRNTGFKVPEDYFQNLTSRVMSNIPDNTNVATIHHSVSWIKPVLTIAAGLALLLLVTHIFISGWPKTHSDHTVANKAKVERNDSPKDAFDATVEYTMVDRDDIYSYITE